MPLLKPHPVWPKVDPLEIIERQPKRGPRVFPYVGDTLGFWFAQVDRGRRGQGCCVPPAAARMPVATRRRGFDPLRLAMVGGHRDLRNVKRYAKLDAERLANE